MCGGCGQSCVYDGTECGNWMLFIGSLCVVLFVSVLVRVCYLLLCLCVIIVCLFVVFSWCTS